MLKVITLLLCVTLALTSSGFTVEDKFMTNYPGAKFIGCYSKTTLASVHQVNNYFSGGFRDETPRSCAGHATNANDKYFSISNQECRSGNELPSDMVQVADSECNLACAVEPNLVCGGGESLAVVYENLRQRPAETTINGCKCSAVTQDFHGQQFKGCTSYKSATPWCVIDRTTCDLGDTQDWDYCAQPKPVKTVGGCECKETFETEAGTRRGCTIDGKDRPWCEVKAGCKKGKGKGKGNAAWDYCPEKSQYGCTCKDQCRTRGDVKEWCNIKEGSCNLGKDYARDWDYCVEPFVGIKTRKGCKCLDGFWKNDGKVVRGCVQKGARSWCKIQSGSCNRKKDWDWCL